MASTTTTASSRVIIFVSLVLELAVCCGGSVTSRSPMASPPGTAAASAPAASNPCFNALLNMSDCLSYVESGSNLTKPDKGCCPELAGLVNANPICLCQLLGNPNSLGIKIDLNKALKLPSVCRVTTPPISTCSAVGVPVSLPPSESPMALPPETVASPAPASNPCLNALLNMSDCLTYVEGGSNLTKPEKGCCPELAGLVKSNPICLCQLLGKPDSLGIKIDLNKALKLPSVCHVTTPPVSACSGISPKGSAPSPSNGVATASPGGDSNSSNEAAANPSGNHDNGNGGIQASSLTFIFGLAIVSVSIFF